MPAFDSIPSVYLQLLDALQQSAIATTPDGTVVGWNRSAENLYGWPRTEAMGRNVLDVTPADVSRADATAIMDALGHGTIWSGEFPVRTRGGDTFVASVTDVPIVDDEHRVVAVVGLSAPSRGAASLTSVLLTFAAACDVVWPGLVEVAIGDFNASVRASEPHLLQLLSVLLMRYAAALARGERIDITVRASGESVLGDFGIRTPASAAWIRIAPRNLATYSVLRDEISAARRSNFAATLVRLVGGWLYMEAAGEDMQITHLLLPMSH